MKKSRRQIEAEMREEMEFHRDARITDLIRRGMTPAEATRTARLEFGNPESHREECRTVLGFRPWDELRADIRYAARIFRNAPGFAFAAIAILALAIGLNAAFFTLYANYVLKPLPIRGVDRHFDIDSVDARAQGTGPWTPAELESLRQAGKNEIEGLYTTSTITALLLAPIQRHIMVTYVSGNYFQLLGGSAARGRTLTEAEKVQPLAVLSHSGSRKVFPAEEDPLGKTVRIQDRTFTIIGVMPPAFTGTQAVVPDLWLPANEDRADISGLLRPGASPGHAQAAFTVAASRFIRSKGEPIARVDLLPRSSLLSGKGDVAIIAGLVFAVFSIVLLIACANLANLFLARAAARTHEIAMRISLGASRARIVRQLLTESIFVALLGAGGGLVLAAIGLREAHNFIGSLTAHLGVSLLPPTVDWRVFLFSAALGIGAGIAFGLLPALEVTSPSLTLSTKREHSSFAGRIRPRRMRNILMGGQVAASLILLILAGLLIRNIQRLDAVEPGYSVDQIFDLRVDKPTPTLLAQLERLPGVVSLTAVERVPLSGQFLGAPATNRVDRRYFETLALPIEAGRNFTDQEAQSNARVAVVSQATARKYWPSAHPIGQTITIEEKQTYQVIGIVPDIVTGFLFEGKDSTAVYLPASAGQPPVGSIIARLQIKPDAIRALCAANGTVCEPVSLREAGAMQRFPFQVAAGIAGMLGSLALLLTTIGLYSVASYSVVQRRREIGVHLALGARPAQVMRWILGEAAWCVAGGVAAGLPICLGLSKLASSSVLQIQTYDPAAYLGVPVLLALIAIFACAVPARRAAQTDPMLSLREE